MIDYTGEPRGPCTEGLCGPAARVEACGPVLARLRRYAEEFKAIALTREQRLRAEQFAQYLDDLEAASGRGAAT